MSNNRNKEGKSYARLKTALTMLEKRYEKFKAAKENKKPWLTHGGTKSHPGRSYEAECARLSNEIAAVKAHMTKAIV